MSSIEESAEHASTLTGLYVHIPFCARRCGYCDFAAFAELEDLAGDYVAAVRGEIARFFGAGGHSADDGDRIGGFENFFAGSSGTTVYCGGGTPTLLDIDSLAEILDPLLATEPQEVTVEANPDTVDYQKASGLARMGVGRISLGVQSFDPAVLAYLDRTHDRRSVFASVDALRAAGITDINLDLIYGAPPEDEASWEQTLRTAVGLRPTHISCYALGIERGTPLWKRISEDGEPGPNPDDQASKMALADAVLGAEGYIRYEISSWALPGHECLHNLIYWGFGRYRGFGSGAHSFDGSTRSWNPRHPRRYIEAERAGRLPAVLEPLDDETLLLDRISLTLRRSVGIAWPLDQMGPKTDRLVAGGLAVVSEGRLRPTSRGMALLNELVVAVCSDLEVRYHRRGCVLSLSGCG